MSKFQKNQRVTIKESSSSKYRGKSGIVISVSHVRHWGTGHDQYCVLLDGGNKKINNLRDGSLEKELTKPKERKSDKKYLVVKIDGINAEIESDLMTKEDAIEEARSIQIENPKLKYGITQLLATTTPPRQVVDIDEL